MSNTKQKPSEHTVEWWGRLFFRVSSASRKGLFHFVDMEPEDGEPMCMCEDSCFRHTQPCRHVAAVIEYLIPQIPENILSIRQDEKPKRQYKLEAA